MNLKQLRQSRGLTKQALADLAGTSRTVIYMMEAGKYNPGLDLVERLLKALEYRIDFGTALENIERRYMQSLIDYRSTKSQRDAYIVELLEKILTVDFLLSAEEIEILKQKSLLKSNL